ncbi:lipocalin-like domain-containing protein [Streptomyces europaeiscabiei]|uniref:lipocalin-like domain-containing protein n=1 Tax=Streptomyces europaeiscabiei TaxID=146819 RepID=UPI002E17D428|nr:lipocalin-like domain-containing protein [Streptomyces europaeiscabiei]
MMTKLRIPRLGLTLALALLVSVPLFVQASATERGTGSLVGVWRMTSLEVGTEGNLQPVPYSGQIVFTKTDTMSVQAMNPDANVPDTPYTKNGYEAFYGTFAINKAARTFGVTVESSLARDLIGQRLTRAFRVSGRTLVLTPPNPAEGWRATYKRV